MIEKVQALLTSLATSFDLPILDWIQAHLQSPVMDKIQTVITLCGEPVVFIVLGLLLVLYPKTRKVGWSVVTALILGVLVCNVTLKPIIARIRPYDLHAQLTGETIKLLVKTPHDWSFPSGHTIAAFETGVAVMIRNKKFGIPVMILGVLISLSRLYIYVHYPTDVIFSVIFGILFGILGCVIVDAVYRKFPPKVGKYQRT